VYLNLAAIMKPVEKQERNLRLYPKLRFSELYHDFNETKYKPFESPFVRKEWKNVIKMLDEINKIIWNIASFRRNVREWDKRKITLLHSTIFRLSLMVRDLHETLMAVISEEEIVWRNYILNAIVVMKQHKLGSLGKDEAYEINPTARISSLRLTLRQIFAPVENLLDSIEAELLSGEVDENKLRQLEDAMLLKVLPWFHKVFRKTIEAGGSGS